MQRSPVSLISVITLIFGLMFSGGDAFAEAGFAESRILAKPAAGLSAEKFDKLLKRFERSAKVKRKLKDKPVAVVEVPSGRERGLVRAIRKSPHFAFVELDAPVAPDAVVNDPE